MNVVQQVEEWRRLRGTDVFAGKSVGFVPTMGNLHAGHLSLLRRACQENDLCVLSIFVNPTQFNDESDLRKYPVTLEEDLSAARSLGVDFVLRPSCPDLYPDGFRYVISEKDLSRRFCGAHRPGHFDGVLTVVMKLLLLVKPQRAYFGEKDYQQLLLVRDMTRAFFLDVQIVPCPLIRDSDGLALSSRNRYLSPRQRERARRLPRILQQAASPSEATAALLEAGFEVDYVEDFEGRRLAAVHVGAVRLVDNVVLES